MHRDRESFRTSTVSGGTVAGGAGGPPMNQVIARFPWRTIEYVFKLSCRKIVCMCAHSLFSIDRFVLFHRHRRRIPVPTGCGTASPIRPAIAPTTRRPSSTSTSRSAIPAGRRTTTGTFEKCAFCKHYCRTYEIRANNNAFSVLRDFARFGGGGGGGFNNGMGGGMGNDFGGGGSFNQNGTLRLCRIQTTQQNILSPLPPARFRLGRQFRRRRLIRRQRWRLVRRFAILEIFVVFFFFFFFFFCLFLRLIILSGVVVHF
jgi:hypothetical protein